MTTSPSNEYVEILELPCEASDAWGPFEKSAKFRQCVQSHTDWINDIALCNLNRTGELIINIPSLERTDQGTMQFFRLPTMGRSRRGILTPYCNRTACPP